MAKSKSLKMYGSFRSAFNRGRRVNLAELTEGKDVNPPGRRTQGLAEEWVRLKGKFPSIPCFQHAHHVELAQHAADDDEGGA
jgi:hypothetical protein